MKKIFTTLFLGALLATTFPASSQDTSNNLLANKPIFTLGEAKTWSYNEESYSFNTGDLAKIVQEPANTDNVFLYPQMGKLSEAEENIKLGIQGFYVDMGSSQDIGTVTTTWEGAAADSFEIYLTNDVPTTDILDSKPTYSVSGLGQYTEYIAVLPSGAKGRYLVFQPTKATNYGWGVKIRSISAKAPEDDILTTFKVSPTIVEDGAQTPMTLTILNQNKVEMSEEVSITISDNATYENGTLTITTGNSATFTAKTNDVTLTATVYVATAPEVPAETAIKTPIFTNTVTTENATAEFTTAYNGGATNKGTVIFTDGEVAQSFLNTQCVFFSNSNTTGDWNGNIDPSSNGYGALCLDVFSGANSTCSIEFESVENLDGGHTYPFELNAGEWNHINVNVAGATKLGNLSIRFAENSATDILLANIYFAPVSVEGDETAPDITSFEASSVTMNSIVLSFSATDSDVEEAGLDLTYYLSDGTETYTLTGKSGDLLTKEFSNLVFNTLYNFTLTVSDGTNVSETSTLQVTTASLPNAGSTSVQPNNEYTNVIAIYSNYLRMNELPTFEADANSTAKMSLIKTSGETPSITPDPVGLQADEDVESVLFFYDFSEDNGGSLINLDLDVTNAEELWISVFATAAGSFNISALWQYQDIVADTSDKFYKVEINEPYSWTPVSVPVSEIGYGTDNVTTIQKLNISNSTIPSFAVDNLYFASKDNSPLAVEGVGAEAETVNVYNMQGICVKSGVTAENALSELPAGLYIVGGKKVLVK